MKSFLKKMAMFLIVAGVLFICVVAVIQLLPPQFTTSDNASMLDKYERLCSIDEPKIILLGGSSLTFGMDSKTLEKEMGMPVVNLGLHAAIKSGFYINLTKENLNKGDIVVFCFEFTGYSDQHSAPFDLLYTLENYPQFWRAVPIHEYPYLAADYFDKYAVKKITRMIRNEDRSEVITNPDYRREAFDAWGDNISPRDTTRTAGFELSYTFLPRSIGKRTVKEMNAYYEYAKKQGATVYISFPPIAISSVKYDVDMIEEYQEALESKLEIPVISDIVNYIYEDKYFYDTQYHLNASGVVLRTEQLLNDLKTVEQPRK